MLVDKAVSALSPHSDYAHGPIHKEERRVAVVVFGLSYH